MGVTLNLLVNRRTRLAFRKRDAARQLYYWRKHYIRYSFWRMNRLRLFETLFGIGPSAFGMGDPVFTGLAVMRRMMKED